MLRSSRFGNWARKWVVTLSKTALLLLPWFFIAHGINVLQSHLVFYNNSVPTMAKVVAAPTQSDPIENPSDLLAALTPQSLKSPTFLYQHENGQAYVGGPIVTPYFWDYHGAEVVEIRYNRLKPQEAQPVSITRFWWPPIAFIGGGFFSFMALVIAFRPKSSKRRRYKNVHGTLKLRRD